MKKLAIAIIGLVFAALVFGACEIKTGGTIEVTNGHTSAAIIMADKSLTVPNTDGMEAVKAGETIRFTFNDDGIYTVYSFFTVIPKSDTVSLFGGETKRITVKP